MAQNGVVTADGRLTDWISLGVLASSVPRDAGDDAGEAADRRGRAAGGELLTAAAFGCSGAGAGERAGAAFPKVRVVTVSECASDAVVDAELGGVAGKGAAEPALARKLYRQLEADWLLIADRNFYNWPDWRAAADSGAALLWRVE